MPTNCGAQALATVNTTRTLAKDADVLKCCWNRHEQMCEATDECDGGGEGCVENGTRTHDHGVVCCFGVWELSAALQRLQRVGTRRAAALSVLTRELIAARTLAKLALRELRAKAQTNRAKSLQVPMFTALGRGSCCHSAEGCSTTQMAQKELYGTRLNCQVRHRTLFSADGRAGPWVRRGLHGLLVCAGEVCGEVLVLGLRHRRPHVPRAVWRTRHRHLGDAGEAF